MKVLALISLLFLSSNLFSQEVCEPEVGCDFGADALVSDTNDCDISDPSCPLPSAIQEISNDKNAQALYWLCVSPNARTKRYGVSLSTNRVSAALLSYRRCLAASGILGIFCQRPRCFYLNF